MNKSRKGILLLGDIVALVLSFIVIWLREGKFHLTNSVFHENIWAFSFIACSTLLMLYTFDLYDFRFIRTNSSNLWRLASTIILSGTIGIIFFYLLTVFHVTPKTNLVVFFISFGILFIIWRRAFLGIFSASFKNKTVIWGTSITAQHLFAEIGNNPHRGYDPLVHVTTTEELISIIDRANFSILVIDDHLQLPDHLIEIIFKKKITALSLIATYEDILQKIPTESIDETIFIKNIQHQNILAGFLKRFFECLAASILLILTSPLTIVAAIAIKIEDRGTFFYKQQRMGFLGEPFLLYKFRSMTEESRRDSIGTDWTGKHDPRITRIGKILRVTHIDEIPQMINILRGDITLVGPRPDVMRVETDLKKTIPHYHLRHLVKPGFTGWAQIKYRAPNDIASFTERFQYDLYYIKHREFFFDIGIIVRTLQIIIGHIQ